VLAFSDDGGADGIAVGGKDDKVIGGALIVEVMMVEELLNFGSIHYRSL